MSSSHGLQNLQIVAGHHTIKLDKLHQHKELLPTPLTLHGDGVVLWMRSNIVGLDKLPEGRKDSMADRCLTMQNVMPARQFCKLLY
jgi:hypothetical protein